MEQNSPVSLSPQFQRNDEIPQVSTTEMLVVKPTHLEDGGS
jgi:hypothetical protein